MSVKLLFLAGSARAQSSNKKLAKQACDIAKELGADAQFIDLKDYPMPIYDGDLEVAEGMPEGAVKLKELFLSCDGFFIASPEYNSSFSPLLKNSIDWISRPSEEKETHVKAFKDKIAAICSAAPGKMGGLRGLAALRMLLGNISVFVVPNQFALAGAMTAFDKKDNLTDEKNKQQLENVVKQLIETTRALKK